MSSIKQFFFTLWHSIWDRSFYEEVLKRKSSRLSLWYLYWLFVLMLFVQMIPLSLGLFTNIDDAQTFVADYKVQAPDFYPEELVITLTEEGARTNVREPYTIEFPELLADKMRFLRNKHIEHAVTIDTTASAEDYLESKSLFLLTKHSLVYPDEHGYRVLPFEQIFMSDKMPEKLVFNQELYRTLAKASFPLVEKLPTLIVALGVLLMTFAPFLGGLFLWIGKLVGLLIPTALLWLLFAKLLKRTIHFSSLFRLSLHGITIPILFRFLGSFLIGTGSRWIALLYFLAWMVFVLWQILPKKGLAKA